MAKALYEIHLEIEADPRWNGKMAEAVIERILDEACAAIDDADYGEIVPPFDSWGTSRIVQTLPIRTEEEHG